MHDPLARAIFLYGGSISVVCVALVILPMLGCSGNLMTGYAACAGGAGATSAANALLPLSISGAYFYLFAGPVLIALALFIERSATRRKSAA
ncbi:hypothetical protein [Ruegeria marina]|nr:hypothetical protein [Ruegeria marina]